MQKERKTVSLRIKFDYSNLIIGVLFLTTHSGKSK